MYMINYKKEVEESDKIYAKQRIAEQKNNVDRIGSQEPLTRVQKPR